MFLARGRLCPPCLCLTRRCVFCLRSAAELGGEQDLGSGPVSSGAWRVHSSWLQLLLFLKKQAIAAYDLGLELLAPFSVTCLACHVAHTFQGGRQARLQGTDGLRPSGAWSPGR